ncbi:hypothetical protein IQ249_19675 [Lusitaniella coriacea LEGE 07157]|uniref:Uncharacterized protein n=1 Tax=Lusitaniella coriacea LEGE 07157 TaxID=945747 RepID=A0A8J7DZC5_9CYAN|nr:hypothetical protein [Lusitaniella coriacea]MBE9118118.1 hypothetical protein [Lusitaniella coriacea LEGE 07157]
MSVPSDNISGAIVPADSEISATPPAVENSPNESSQRLEELAREIIELKLDSLSEADERRRLVQALRRQVRWLLSILAVVLTVFGGTLAWLVVTQTLERAQLKQQLRAVTVTRQELEGLADELKAVRAELPDSLVRDLKDNQSLLKKLDAQFQTIEGNQKHLEELDVQFNDLEETVNTRQKALAVLANALQDLVNAEESQNPNSTTDTEPNSP